MHWTQIRQRSAERAEGAVSAWKRENVYPYSKDPSSPVELAERQVFDICAINVAENLPDFDKSDEKQRRFTFRLLRQAIEDNPASVQQILSDILNLPRTKQDELAKLLEKPTLSAIISASTLRAPKSLF